MNHQFIILWLHLLFRIPWSACIHTPPIQIVMSQLAYKNTVGDSIKTGGELKPNGLRCSSSSTNPITLSEDTRRCVKHNLPSVNPHWLLPVTFLYTPRKVYQEDLRTEADQPAGPCITMWAYSEDKCSFCLCLVIRDIPAPPRLASPWHSQLSTSGCTYQVPWTHMTQILSSSPSLCFPLLLTAVSSLNSASKHRAPGDLTTEDLGIKALNIWGRTVPTITHSATSFNGAFVKPFTADAEVEATS